MIDGMKNKSVSSTKLYMYRLTADTGMAPCVDNGLLSLAVCKGGQIRKGVPCYTGLRHLIGSRGEFASGRVYILGTYHDRFLYLARVTEVVTMEDYYHGMSDGRTDDIYDYLNGKLVRNNLFRKLKIHTESDRIIKDVAGQYVILSNDYIYLGEDAVFIDIVKKYNARFQETKTYTGDIAEKIINECRKYKDKKKHKPHEPISMKCGI